MRNRDSSRLDQFRRADIDAWDYPQVRRFVSMPRRTIYINTSAKEDAKIIKLSFHDRELLRI